MAVSFYCSSADLFPKIETDMFSTWTNNQFISHTISASTFQGFVWGTWEQQSWCWNVLILTIHLDQDTLHVHQATVGEPTDLALSTIQVMFMCTIGMVYVGNSSTCLMRWRNKNISIVIVKRQSSSYSLKSMYQTNLTDVHKMYQKASLLIIHNLRLIDAVKWHILMEKTQVKMCQAFSWNVFCTRNQVRNPAMLCCNDTLMGQNVPQWEREYILMMTLF